MIQWYTSQGHSDSTSSQVSQW